ncbi:hypothetical protein GCM10010151_03320 [Actinoallomurus spadix]|uniref:Uncharacterized protein n=1 Tax=Actinoallomurus spadix TaxID=79912 RepID=A0ABN0VT62_9ACTN
MGSVSTISKSHVKHQVSTLRECGGRINDAVNIWVEATSHIDAAWLPFNALGVAGEAARVGESGYEGNRREAIERLNAAANGLISFREAIYQVADKYAGTEIDNAATAKRSIGLTHRPDI